MESKLAYLMPSVCGFLWDSGGPHHLLQPGVSPEFRDQIEDPEWNHEADIICNHLADMDKSLLSGASRRNGGNDIARLWFPSDAQSRARGPGASEDVGRFPGTLVYGAWIARYHSYRASLCIIAFGSASQLG